MEDFSFTVKSQNGSEKVMEVHQKHLRINKRSVKTWSREEDSTLLSLYSQHPKRWAEIASRMQGRNENQCLHRYRRLTQLGRSQKNWTQKEDQAIVKMVRKYGYNWKILSQMISGRTGKQIRERYLNKLDPKIRHEEWTQQEDWRIIKYYGQLGSKWSLISKKLPGRPQNAIKNRFYSFIRKNYEVLEKHQQFPSETRVGLSEKKAQEGAPASDFAENDYPSGRNTAVVKGEQVIKAPDGMGLDSCMIGWGACDEEAEDDYGASQLYIGSQNEFNFEF